VYLQLAGSSDDARQTNAQGYCFDIEQGEERSEWPVNSDCSLGTRVDWEGVETIRYVRSPALEQLRRGDYSNGNALSWVVG
jgi:hypothetical protein